ncbi:Ku protein [Streptomyces sp. AK02-01A]|uniref:non-homologous end joining protein Ku n=1 Tax=Streptomyces sp. AK02-01A TaxID=3028648 RepID=UPI0029BDFB6B|nr:Ku protein [Streptomyces sp. AK02-01A]MDX3852138.1 Ku protein [Streptomyces sp. AK02-01A]
MRSIWNGAISFGLVSIPIKLVNATENHSISFRQVHKTDMGRIRYRKVCELEEREVASGEIGKGYEEPDGSIIPITDDDLAALPLPTAKTIEIVGFVPAASIDPLQMDASYYLAPSGAAAAKPYVLLREALKRSDKAAVAKFALRGRERLGMLRVMDDVIAMHGLLWPDEIRTPVGVAPETEVTVRDAELDLADALMDTLGAVDLESLHDDYREAVEELIAAKVEGEPIRERQPAESGGGKVIDLMAALENSVRAAKEARGEDGQVAEVTQLKSKAKPEERPAEQTAEQTAEKTAEKTAERAPAKKTAAKSPARKTAAKKTAASKRTGAAKKTTTAKKSAAKKTATAKKTSSGKRASA